jgi:hypothetical protein
LAVAEARLALHLGGGHQAQEQPGEAQHTQDKSQRLQIRDVVYGHGELPQSRFQEKDEQVVGEGDNNQQQQLQPVPKLLVPGPALVFYLKGTTAILVGNGERVTPFPFLVARSF